MIALAAALLVAQSTAPASAQPAAPSAQPAAPASARSTAPSAPADVEPAAAATARVAPAASASDEAAQTAFDAGEYARAEALALAGARTGAMLYLAGLSRFRQGNFAGALALLDEAGRAQDPPPAAAWSFNEGAALYELGRHREAEARFLEAARDESLRFVALLQASWAALDGGDAQRAALHAAEARSAARDEKELSLLSELDARLGPSDYQRGIEAFDRGDFAEARALFHGAAARDPEDGKARIMEAASSVRLGFREDARDELQGALHLDLDEADARTARSWLLLAEGDQGFSGSARLGAGYDTNPLQTGLFEPEEVPGASATQGSALATFDLALSERHSFGDLQAELAYGLEQLAYFDSSASDRSLQEHALSLTLAMPITERIRGGASLVGALDFTGLSDFRGLQDSLRAGLFASYDETAQASLRLDVAFTLKDGLVDEFSYLSGTRTEVALSQSLALGALELHAGYAFRYEDIGTASTVVPCPEGPQPPGCQQTSVEAFGYAGHTLWASAKYAPFERLALSLAGGVELRSYLDDEEAIRDNRIENAKERIDQLWFASASVSLKLFAHFGLSLRYDLYDNVSNVSGDPGPDRQYTKQVVSLGTLFWW